MELKTCPVIVDENGERCGEELQANRVEWMEGTTIEIEEIPDGVSYVVKDWGDHYGYADLGEYDTSRVYCRSDHTEHEIIKQAEIDLAAA